jgi:hypothetical protein
MPQYTVRNDKGREVTFEWHGQGEPTDADMEEVFAAAGDEPAEKPWYKRGIDDLQAVRDLREAGFGQSIDGAMSGGLSSAAPAAMGAAKLLSPNVSSVIKRGAERMYGGLLKAKDATVERFPNVVKDLLASGTPISKGGRASTISRLKSIGTEKGALLQAADARAMVPRATLRSGLDDVLDDVIKTSEAPVKDMGKLAKIERDLIPDELGVLPSRADKIKTKLNSESDRALRQMKMGTRVSDTTARAKTGVALKAKQAVEAIEPKMADVNARYGSNKGQAEALREALKRTEKHGAIGMNDLIGGTLGLAGGPAGVPAGVAAMRVLTNPNMGSRIAIGLDRVAKTPQLDQATRLAMMALLSDRSGSQ